MNPATFLERIVAHKRRELDGLDLTTSWVDVEEQARRSPPTRDPLRGLHRDHLGVIAEIKRASPSRGDLAPDLDAVLQARRYADRGDGADAISVLTDSAFYRGSLADLASVRGAVETPVLAKDFILDRRGLLLARTHGADLILLIVQVLGVQVAEMIEEARALQLCPLVEVATVEEAELALGCGALFIGINNRDLRTFQVDLARTERIMPAIGDRATVASLSGIATRRDAERVAAAGARLVLVGEALMVAEDPAALIRELKSVPTASRTGDRS